MITIQDNNYIGKVCPFHKVADFFSFANKSITQLCEEDEFLLVFPFSIDDADDGIGDSSIVEIYVENEKTVRMKSGNIMGFVGRNNQQLKIYSRFDNGKQDYFLHYMILRVFSFNVFNLDFTSSGDNVLDILIYMFPVLLKRSMSQGLYKEYRTVKHNDSNVCGTIDISRHICENNPFRGDVAYNTREYSFDNSVMELIRHTIEHIKSIPFGENLLKSNELTERYVRDIISCTPSYRHSDRLKVIHENLTPCNHPYYTEYLALQKLCIQILRQEEMKYGIGNDSVLGILFDGAWLWEEYINTLLCELGFIHPENKKGTGAIYLFEHGGGQRFPDFWKQDFVLDAKYKKLAINDNVLDVDREDVNQIVTYMFRLKAKKGGIICPLIGNENKIISKNMHRDAYKGVMYIYALAIPRNCRSYDEFVKRISMNEKMLLKNIKKVNS